jgi:transposase
VAKSPREKLIDFIESRKRMANAHATAERPILTENEKHEQQNWTRILADMVAHMTHYFDACEDYLDLTLELNGVPVESEHDVLLNALIAAYRLGMLEIINPTANRLQKQAKKQADKRKAGNMREGKQRKLNPIDAEIERLVLDLWKRKPEHRGNNSLTAALILSDLNKKFGLDYKKDTVARKITKLNLR